MSTWIVNEPSRLDVAVATAEPTISRSRHQRLIESGNVTVDGIVETKCKILVQPGSTIVFTPPEVEPEHPIAEALPLSILFEDESILVINKAAGMVVHPNDFHEHNTLVQAVLAIRPEIVSAVYDPENRVSRLRPGVVHRLDKDTTGVIVFAKNREALLNLSAQFQNHTTKKEYIALVYGKYTDKQTITAPIRRRGGGDKNRMGASHDPEDGREAITHFAPIKTWIPYAAWPQEMVTKVSVRIETGRTHQIRVHAKFIGHPVLGDILYGNKPSIKLSEKLGIERQLLHAASLTIQHPVSNESLTFTAPLSSDFPPEQ
jgi:23S rRNA pseudouridine1911/1915/1917 synthase